MGICGGGVSVCVCGRSALWGGVSRLGVVGGRVLHDDNGDTYMHSIRPSRLRHTRPKNSLKTKNSLSATEELNEMRLVCTGKLRPHGFAKPRRARCLSGPSVVGLGVTFLEGGGARTDTPTHTWADSKRQQKPGPPRDAKSRRVFLRSGIEMRIRTGVATYIKM